jgi:hypothetical protein
MPGGGGGDVLDTSVSVAACAVAGSPTLASEFGCPGAGDKVFQTRIEAQTTLALINTTHNCQSHQRNSLAFGATFE